MARAAEEEVWSTIYLETAVGLLGYDLRCTVEISGVDVPATYDHPRQSQDAEIVECRVYGDGVPDAGTDVPVDLVTYRDPWMPTTAAWAQRHQYGILRADATAIERRALETGT